MSSANCYFTMLSLKLRVLSRRIKLKAKGMMINIESR